MKKLMPVLLAALLLLGCARQAEPTESEEQTALPVTQPTQDTTEAPTTEPPDPVAEILEGLSLEEKVGQLFLARCRAETAIEDIENYHLGGYVLFGVDFQEETQESLKSKLCSYQGASQIPMLLAVDEEGGTVCRVSRYPAFRSEKFPEPRESYEKGGLALALSMESEKAYLLHSLGLNVNLAPVCDISQNPDAFMYHRSLGADPVTTGAFVTGTLERMWECGVGGVMKHFPGYGENGDTHTGQVTDTRALEELEGQDLVPFAAGIAQGLGAILVSHNIVTALDDSLPASLSPKVVDYLRDNMGFQGVIVTDDLVMGALGEYTPEEAAVLAVQAGATLLCSTDFDTQIPAVLEAVRDGRISEAAIDDAAYRNLTWKLQLGLLEQ